VAAVVLEDVQFAVLPQAPQVVPCQQLVEDLLGPLIATRVPVAASPLLAQDSPRAAEQAQLQMNGGSGP